MRVDIYKMNFDLQKMWALAHHTDDDNACDGEGRREIVALIVHNSHQKFEEIPIEDKKDSVQLKRALRKLELS